MIVSAVEDIIRKKLAVPDLDPVLLKEIRQLARSEIEAIGNFHWQATSTDILIPIGVDAFDVKVDFIAPDFQEFRFLALQKGEVGSEVWRFIFPGSWQSTLEGIAVAGAGFPERATYENDTLTVSPIPAGNYEGFMYYFQVTDEPEDITDTDDLYTMWPQLILFQSLAVGERLLNKSIDNAQIWEKLAQDQAEKALAYTQKLIGEPGQQISASTAAKILQAQVGKAS